PQPAPAIIHAPPSTACRRIDTIGAHPCEPRRAADMPAGTIATDRGTSQGSSGRQAVGPAVPRVAVPAGSRRRSPQDHGPGNLPEQPFDGAFTAGYTGVAGARSSADRATAF